MAIALQNVHQFEGVEQARTHLHHQTIYLKQEVDEKGHFSDIIGESPAMVTMLSEIATVAPTDSTVLIVGKTGTGKELVARAMHAGSEHKAGPLITVNCKQPNSTLGSSVGTPIPPQTLQLDNRTRW